MLGWYLDEIIVFFLRTLFRLFRDRKTKTWPRVDGEIHTSGRSSSFYPTAEVTYMYSVNRRRRYSNEKFDFLGYTFRPRRSKNRFGKFFVNFSPAVSDQAVKAIREEIRSWNLPQRSDKAIEDLSRMFNLTQRSEAGSNTTDGIIVRRSIRRCDTWIESWPGGPTGNTRSCVGICAGRHTGLRA